MDFHHLKGNNSAFASDKKKLNLIPHQHLDETHIGASSSKMLGLFPYFQKSWSRLEVSNVGLLTTTGQHVAFTSLWHNAKDSILWR